MKVIRDHTKKSWDKPWTTYLASIPLGTVRAPAQLPTTGYRPQVHLGASKATSSLITQIRTEKIGLNAFLADRHVPDKVSNVHMRKVTTNGEAHYPLLPGVRRRARQPVYSRRNKGLLENARNATWSESGRTMASTHRAPPTVQPRVVGGKQRIVTDRNGKRKRKRNGLS
jgi:hypothetical protein